ncbi:tudor domain-containing protein 7, partial [Leptonychotes weddellii]|uniref:Tudor domain-containing protein 7 n=1 Tax=Leptonychotes weddellii TaxID=9713 RepID=A0A7F8QDV7_LEPWE
MLEADLVSKMLRAVLQSHKNGIALPRLQGEYRSLTGDWIPFKQLGYPTLEAYLRSVPAVVRIETSRSGEITCYAMACTETARIAQLVARQRSSKRKTGRQVNCQMRVKKTMPFFLEGKPKATLRQPGISSDFSISKKPNPTLLRDKGNSLGVKSDAEMPPYTLHTTIGSEVFKDVPVQRHVTMSTNNRFSPKASLPPPFQMHLSRTCAKEMSDNLNQTVEKPNVTPPASYTYKMDEVQNRIKEILNKHNNGIWISKLPHFYKELYKEELNQGILQQFEHWPHICTVRFSLFLPSDITNVHSSRALDVQFLDSGTVTSVKVSELREIPPRFLQEIIVIPPQYHQVCYVDYGFSENIEKSKAYKLNPKFCSLSFQATKCKLAGLEVLSDDPDLVKVVESLTCGKIFAVEILEKADIPLVVLYDTSGEDDVNINATCLKAICDKSLEAHLQIDAMYTNVRVTNICSDGTLYCQVPCKGLNKLNDLLHKIEDYFHCKHMTSEYFVSLPFCGKVCLFHCKGKWLRVE